jgi:hypothetical protein
MKTRMLLIFVVILIAIATFFLFGRVDSAMEIDSLKEQIKLQRKEMHFLESIVNSSLSSCKTSVADFEEAVHANGRDVLWQGDGALVGAFKAKRKDSCLESINVVDGL